MRIPRATSRSVLDIFARLCRLALFEFTPFLVPLVFYHMLSLFSISLTQQSSGSAVAASAGTFLGSTDLVGSQKSFESPLEQLDSRGRLEGAPYVRAELLADCS